MINIIKLNNFYKLINKEEIQKNILEVRKIIKKLNITVIR